MRQADVDLSGQGGWVRDVTDGDALNRLFLDSTSGSRENRAVLVLELWNHLFVPTSAGTEVCEPDSTGPPTPRRT